MLDAENPEEIISSAWDNRPRRMFAHVCEQCSKRYFAPMHAKSRFCAKPCTIEARKKQVEKICAQCSKRFDIKKSQTTRSKSGLHFCGRTCKDLAQRLNGIKALQLPHYGAPVSREQLIRERGHACQVCDLWEWMDKPISLEMDHIDGNAYNNDRSNLRLLCPNCHSQTSTYKGRNKDRGRKSRLKKWFKE